MNDVISEETVAFWNCGLAPPGNGAYVAGAADRDVAAETIRSLVRGGASMLGLCEVDEACITHLRPYLPPRYGVRAYVHRQGRFRWDLALAYDRAVWENRRPGTSITVSFGKHTYKAAYRTRFRHIPTETDVVVYLAH